MLEVLVFFAFLIGLVNLFFNFFIARFLVAQGDALKRQQEQLDSMYELLGDFHTRIPPRPQPNLVEIHTPNVR